MVLNSLDLISLPVYFHVQTEYKKSPDKYESAGEHLCLTGRGCAG